MKRFLIELIVWSPLIVAWFIAAYFTRGMRGGWGFLAHLGVTLLVAGSFYALVWAFSVYRAGVEEEED